MHDAKKIKKLFYENSLYCLFIIKELLYYPNIFRTISRRLVEKLDVGIWEIASKAKGNGRSSLVIFIKLTLCPVIYITFPSNFLVQLLNWKLKLL